MSEKKKKEASEVEEGKKSKKDVSEGGEGKKKKKEKSEGGEEKKKKEKSEGGSEKKKKEKSEGGEEKKKKEKSEGGEEKKKKEKSEGGEEKKKKEKIEGGEEKKKRDPSEISELKQKGKKAKNVDDDLLQDILKEDKAGKVAKLEEELELLKNTLKKRKDVDILTLPPAAKLEAENDYLEAQIRELKGKYERLEDKFDIIKKAHRNATEALSQAHIQAMDQEEMEFMRMQLENKRNDLAEARNLIRELQKVGWSMLPPKVADESRKTEKELDTVLKNVQLAEEESKTLQSEVEKTKIELHEVQDKYKSAKDNGKTLEEKLDKVVTDIAKIQQEIESKAEEARDMEAALKAVSLEIEAAGISVTKMVSTAESGTEIDPEKAAKLEEKRRKKEDKKMKKFGENDENKRKYEGLKEEVNKKEEELRKLKKELKEMGRLAKEATLDKNAMKKLENDKLALMKEVNEIKKSHEKEMNLRKMYYNIIEDMLGKVKVFCRCREEQGKEGVQVVDEFTLKILGSKPQEFQFDKVFGQKIGQAEIFKSCDFLYDYANDGFNCCCFVYGESDSGKTFTTIGSAENEGIIRKGFNKIGDILKKNKKNQLQTRMTIYMIEIFNDRIYDLIKNNSNSSIDIRRDYYGMVVIANAEYKECATEGELRNTFNNAVNNRPNAFTKLECQPNQSHFVTSISIEVGNKFQKKYSKGKITVIKLAGTEKLGGSGSMNNSLAALGDVISALTAEKPFIPYKSNKLTMLMQDALGGGAKTLMICCISPLDTHISETINTLTYGSRVKSIKNESIKNSDSEEIYKLKNNIERLIRGVKMEQLILAI